MFQAPSDVAFEILGFSVYWYGIIMAVAVFCGFSICAYLCREKYGNDQLIWDISPVLIIAGILGARLYYCIVNYKYYSENPLEIFDIRQGGLSVHGMIIFGSVALYLLLKSKKIPFFKFSDVFVIGVILGQSIGRWGNFFNSEAFGTPTDLPWKLFIPLQNRPEEYINYEFFHPTFLYESLLDLVLFFILIILFKKDVKPKGLITFLYLFGYSLIRTGVETFRVDSVLNIFGVPVAQFISGILLIISLIAILSIKKNNL